MDDWLKKQPDYGKIQSGTTSEWFWILRTEREFLKDSHMDAALALLRVRHNVHSEWFRSERVCFAECMLTMMWTAKYKEEFLPSSANADGGGKLLPGGALDYQKGDLPSYGRTKKLWGVEVDDIYVPLHIKGDHWVALWINIPMRHIVVWDSIYSYTSDAEIAVLVEPICVIMPHVIRDTCMLEDRWKHTYEPYTHERVKAGVPQNVQSGDCGVYTLKYIELHALGLPFSSSSLCDANILAIREKLAAEIFDETEIRGTEFRDYSVLDLYES